MNKKIVTAIIVFVVVLLLVVLVGIFGNKFLNKERTYDTEYLSFNCNEALLEKELNGYSIYFENLTNDIVILGKKEVKSELLSLGHEDLNLEKYSKLVYENEKDTISDLKLSEDKRFYYFTYDYKEGIDDIFYLVGVYETKDDFWMINFAGELDKQKQLEEKFLKWANSVKFKEN